jgi:hypothetical protein
MVAATTPPTLITAEIDDLMVLARRPGPSGVDPDSELGWTTGLVLAVDDYVVPSNRTGLRYRVTATDGTPTATEPTWPLSGASVTHEGVSYTGYDTGVWTPTYDLYAAAAEGWRWKAGKIADAFDFSTDQQSFDRSQKVAHCMKMAEYYDKRAGTSIYGGGVETSARGIVSARVTRDRQMLGMGYRRAPIFGDAPETDDEDQAIPWVANS